MTHAQHTPGPWTAGDDGGIWATHEDGEPFEVASADCFADVRLIAEAPAMLAALRDAFAGKPNDDGGQCRHCGRDNAGEDQDRCAYFGPDDENNCPYENARAIFARIDGASA